jgi:hypothetical protein
MATVDRRTFLRHAAAGGGVLMAGPLAAYAARSAAGAQVRTPGLFVNQQGVGRAIPAVTYAIWGPWARRGRG